MVQMHCQGSMAAPSLTRQSLQLQVPAGHVYLMTYKFEEYAGIARALHIPLHPCAHFEHVALLPYRCDVVARLPESAQQWLSLFCC